MVFFRFWLRKAKAVLLEDVSAAQRQGLDPKDSLRKQKAARHEILPDAVLQRVISSHLYSAITYPLRQQEQQQQQRCIKAWLGVGEGTPQAAVAALTQGRETCNEGYFSPDDVVSLPRKTRVQLYR